MKFFVAPITATALFLAACHDAAVQHKAIALPKPGTTVASAEMLLRDDTLNNFTFSIKIIADSSVAQGVYDVDADYGPNYAAGQFTLPTGAENATPVIHTDSAGHSFVIGFKIPGDTTFYDYYQVAGTRTSMKMQYIKAYTF